MVKVCLQWGRPGFDPWVRKMPWRRKRQPTPVLLPGEFHRWRSLVVYSPWGCKELDRTEWFHFFFFHSIMTYASRWTLKWSIGYQNFHGVGDLGEYKVESKLRFQWIKMCGEERKKRDDGNSRRDHGWIRSIIQMFDLAWGRIVTSPLHSQTNYISFWFQRGVYT